MLNGILTALLIFSVVTAAFTGRMEALSAAALSGCSEAVTLVITLTGMLCLWSGLMEIVICKCVATLSDRSSRH